MNWRQFFANELFSSWERLATIAVGALFFYFVIVSLVRLLGKRTTSQMNNFDWIITIAVGSLAASGILLKNVTLLDAFFAIAMLGLLQWMTTWLVIRSNLVARLVKAEPTLLTHKGRFLEDAMKRTRVSREEILSTLRAEGITDCDGANWVILETNGEMSVIPRQEMSIEDVDTLEGVNGCDDIDDPSDNCDRD